MQREIDAAHPPKPIHILGINAAGQESDNELMCQGRVLPWLQDTTSQRVWDSWQVTWRDVVVLDPENKVIRIYNLTEHNLGAAANYTELRNILLLAAQ